MKNIFFTTLIYFFFTTNIFAQFQVDDANVPPYTPQNLITNYFLGQGIEVKSIKYDGVPSAVGYFQNGNAAIGIDRGIVMTTGSVSNNFTTKGVANFGKEQSSTDNGSLAKDADLLKIATGPVFNMSIYTIEFVPTSDTLRFKYVFASEEYPEFACDVLNDVFGFFISGPGINGTFSSNGKNIALVPGTNLNVSINNVHPNNGPGCNAKNVQYYKSNNGSNSFPVYDGVLKVFTAEAIVIPCQTYIIKLAIADVGDSVYDSGVFLEAKSFGTAGVKVVAATPSLDGAVAEGCSNGIVTFKLPRKAEKDFVIDLKLVGSAINGIDYDKITLPLVIPKGDSLIKIPILAINDDIVESTEAIGFDVRRDPCNRDTFWVYIEDNKLQKPKLGADLSICIGDSVKLNGSLSSTLPPNPRFENKTKYPINTITPTKPNVTPTTSGINVFGVNPPELSEDVLNSVCFNMRHAWIDDIDAYLIAPSGQFIELSTDNGADGGNDSDDDFYTNTCFSPKATKRIAPVGGFASDKDVPFTGTYLPEGVFSDLWSAPTNPTNGLWKLQVIDDATGFNGEILDWSLTFNTIQKLYYKWSPTNDLSCTDCPNPSAKPKQSMVYVLEVSNNYGCITKDTINITIKDTLNAPIVTCKDITTNNITFVWTDSLPNKIYEFDINNSGNWKAVPGGKLEYTVNNLAINTTVIFSVRSIGDCTYSKVGFGSCTTLNCAITASVVSKNVSCPGGSNGSAAVSVIGGLPEIIYKWSNNVFAPTIDKLSVGTYTVTVTEGNGCTAVASAIITEPINSLNIINTVKDISCFGKKDGKIVINGNGGNPPYRHSINGIDFFSGNDFSDLKNGNYTIYIKDQGGCTTSKSDILILEPNKFSIELGLDTIVKYGKILQLDPILNNGISPFTYTWEKKDSSSISCLDCKNPIVSTLVSADYALTVTDINGCEANDFKRVIVQFKSDIWIPTGFSPNKDGNNDLLLVHGEDGGKVLVLLIYDRWGEQIYAAENFDVNDASIGWDGRFRNLDVPEGIYVWRMKVKLRNGQIEDFKGQTTVVR